MDNWRQFLIDAYGRFHEMADRPDIVFPGLFSFSIADTAKKAKGGGSHHFVWGQSVPSELRETVNQLNAWCMCLHHWGVWIKLLEEYEEDQQWELESHFVEPLAYFCMHQPQAVAERILMVAENAIHQANLAVFPNAKDRLDQDDRPPGRPLGVDARKKQLNRISARWLRYAAFRNLWAQIDSRVYRKLSLDFRNLSNHSIAPRFRMGVISRVHRSIVPASVMQDGPNGTVQFVEDPSRQCVRYAFGEVPPLQFDVAYAANADQLRLVFKVMHAFEGLIEELSDAMNAKAVTG